MTKVLRPHDPHWAYLFITEAQSLRGVFGDALVTLHHIGSTAVPGLVAKPVIDILGEARTLTDIDVHNALMESAGYEPRGEYGIPGRRYFSKKASTTSGAAFHVHVFQQGSVQIGRHLCFRDFLRTQPRAAQDYAALKLSLRDVDGALQDNYTDRKTSFIERIDQLALAGESYEGG